jgi:hemolysin-activating ACP:hemolysin acyltransferase
MTKPTKKSTSKPKASASNGADAAAELASETKPSETTGTASGGAGLDAETARKISELRATLRENFGKVVMALMMVPRYRNMMLGDLQHLVLDPILQDRIAIAYPNSAKTAPETDMAGFAIWASVSEEVDARIREQIAQGTFPVRLKPQDWSSGEINWLFDVIAQDSATIATVIANFRQVAKKGELRLHPIITRMVDRETLEKMGARRTVETTEESEPASQS